MADLTKEQIEARIAELKSKAQPQTTGPSLDDINARISELKGGSSKMGFGEAALKGAQEFGTFGLSPLIAGVGGAVGKAAGTFQGLGDETPFLEKASAAIKSIPSGFSEARQQQKAEEAQARKEQPLAYYGAGLPAAIVSSGGLGAAAKGGLLGAGKVAEGAKLISGIPATKGQALAQGVAQGTLQAAGQAESLGEAGKTIATSAIVSPVAQLLGNKLTKKLSGQAKEAAEEQAFRALGPYSREARKAYAKNEINKIGRTMLDEGVLGKGMLPKSYEQIADAAQLAKEQTGKKIGGILDEVGDFENRVLSGVPVTATDVAEKAGVIQAGINRDIIAKELETELLKIKNIPGVENENKLIQSLIEEFRSNPDPLRLKSAVDLKQALKNEINWDRLPGADIPVKEQFYRSLYSKISKGIEDTSEGLAQLAAGTTRKEQYKAAKKIYGHLSTAVDIAKKRDANEIARRILSPSDYGVGAAGALGGLMMGAGPAGIATGAALGLANKAVRRYGAQTSAKALDAASKKLAKGIPISSAVSGVTRGLLEGE